MALDLANYEKKTATAVRKFWKNREAARKRQVDSGRTDQGERASVTAGKNMDGFLDLVSSLVRRNGMKDAKVLKQGRVLTLPGYFRPTKIWDLLILRRGRLVAAIELKSQVGPSFGNNFNNRAEEAIGTAVDLWTAYREGAFGEQSRPFLGWLILLEDTPASRNPVKNRSPHFQLLPDFQNASYADRYDVFCKKLVQERLYSAACVLMSPHSAARTGKYVEMSKATGLHVFVTELAGHIAAEAVR